MSYIICNEKKIKHDGIPPVQKENERDEQYNGANKNIDHSRTGNNIRFVERGQSYLTYIKQRVKEVGARIKKDSVLLSSWVITASPEWFKGMRPEHIQEYFRECYRFFAERYGEENIVGAVVHLDETTPHMHLNMVPIYQGHRLCCKHLFDRVALRKLQTDIYEQVGKHWGLKRGEKGSKTKHLDVAEYKVKMAEEKAAEITVACVEAEQGLANVKAEKRNSEKEVERLSTQKETLTKEVDDLSEVKDAATCPIPVVGKTSVITSLRVENAKLKQENADLSKRLDVAMTETLREAKRADQAERSNEAGKKALDKLRELERTNPEAYNELMHPTPKPRVKSTGNFKY